MAWHAKTKVSRIRVNHSQGLVRCHGFAEPILGLNHSPVDACVQQYRHGGLAERISRHHTLEQLSAQVPGLKIGRVRLWPETAASWTVGHV